MTPSPRILVIEDEPAIADTLVYALRTDGFSPEWRHNGRDGLRALAGEVFALVILDVGLPDMNGFDICRELRARGPVPVLFLTARASEVDRIVGLELGGDDYVTKPFSPREVTARVRAILRRTQSTGRLATMPSQPGGTDGDLKTGGLDCDLGLRVDSECKRASWAGRTLDLTRYEFRLLALLHSRPGRVWSRDELMARVWEDPGASLDRTVDAHVKTLRAKLRLAGTGADEIIQTHRGEGYSLKRREPGV